MSHVGRVLGVCTRKKQEDNSMELHKKECEHDAPNVMNTEETDMSIKEARLRGPMVETRNWRVK